MESDTQHISFFVVLLLLLQDAGILLFKHYGCGTQKSW